MVVLTAAALVGAIDPPTQAYLLPHRLFADEAPLLREAILHTTQCALQRSPTRLGFSTNIPGSKVHMSNVFLMARLLHLPTEYLILDATFTGAESWRSVVVDAQRPAGLDQDWTSWQLSTLPQMTLYGWNTRASGKCWTR